MNFEFLGCSGSDFLQCQFHTQSQVGSPILSRLMASATKSTESPETAVPAEYITEGREDVVHAEPTGATESTETASAFKAFKAKLVVALPLLRVVEYVISFGCLLEFFLRFLIAGIAVGMIFDSQLSVSFLYLIFCGVLTDA